jgi:membrane fusion protein, multidrug efflux system
MERLEDGGDILVQPAHPPKPMLKRPPQPGAVGGDHERRETMVPGLSDDPGFNQGESGRPIVRRLVWLLVWSIIGFAIWWFYPQIKQLLATSAPSGPPPGARVVPVIAVTARKGDLPIYLTGLGTVTPLNTVTIRSRVDGPLLKIWFVEGKPVEAGAPLADIDPAPYAVQVAQAEGQKAKDKAQLDNARIDLDRYQHLQKQTFATTQQVDTQQALVNQYEGMLKSDDAQIASANLLLGYCHITSPIAGRVGLRMVDEGNMVHASDPNGLAVITQLRPISVVFTLPQDNIPQVMLAMKATTQPTVEAYDRDLKDRLATGTLQAIDNQVDLASGTLRLKAQFLNTDGVLFPNQFVNAKLLVDTRKQAVLVPTAAVQYGPAASTFVYVVKADQTVEIRNVTIGPSEGEQMCIESSLAAGEVVVVEGVDKLQAGTKVNVRQPTTRPTTRPATQPGRQDARTTMTAGGGAGGTRAKVER